MNHARALCYAADFAFDSAYLEAHGYLFLYRVGSHYRLRRRLGAVAEPCFERGNAGGYGVDAQRLTDNAGRSDYNVGCFYPESARCKLACALGYLYAVCVAGVRVSAVADNRLSLAVFKMIFVTVSGAPLTRFVVYTAAASAIFRCI